jgi:hypothetical protein
MPVMEQCIYCCCNAGLKRSNLIKIKQQLSTDISAYTRIAIPEDLLVLIGNWSVENRINDVTQYGISLDITIELTKDTTNFEF